MFENKIICNDCVLFMKEMEDSSIDLIVTDPPYGINYCSGKQNCDTRNEKTIIKNRDKYFNKISGDEHLPTLWIKEAYRVLKKNSAMYVFCHWSKWSELFSTVISAGFKCKNMIVLNKSNHGMGDLKGSYAPKHELILFATKGRHVLNFPKKRDNDVWNVSVLFSGKKRLHPNEKPISWVEPCIENSSKENDVVLDPFCGSGVVGLCAKKMNRKYLMIDVDENWIETSKRRLES